MEFTIDRVECLAVSDKEIFDLLSEVYVQAGYTESKIAQTVFDPQRVRKRGVLFVSKDRILNEMAGMVIVVPPDSKAVVVAKDNECELHLMAVLPKFRQQGLGRQLLTKALHFAIDKKWSKMILWTQKSMKEAQSLYESFGFIRNGERENNGIEFLIYEKQLT